MSVWEDVHAGAIVLGHDQLAYGVLSVWHTAHGPVVTLIRHGVVTGPAQPPPGTPITIVSQPDMSAEAAAFGALSTVGLQPELLGEMIGS